jgi:hypothetical protein
MQKPRWSTQGRSTLALLPRTLQFVSLFHISTDLFSDLFSSKYDEVQILGPGGHVFVWRWSIKVHLRAPPVWGWNFIRRTRCSFSGAGKRLTARDVGIAVGG